MIKNIITAFCIFVFMASISYAEDSFHPANRNFKMMKIKKRAEKGRTQGAIIYEYVDDSNLSDYSSSDIGNIDEERSRRAREIYVAIDIDKGLNSEGVDENSDMQIGNVDIGRNSRAGKVYVTVDIDDQLGMDENRNNRHLEVGNVNSHKNNRLNDVKINVDLQ